MLYLPLGIGAAIRHSGPLAAAGEASIPDSIHLNYKLKELTHADVAAAAPSATLEKARARHVVQGAPQIPIRDSGCSCEQF